MFEVQQQSFLTSLERMESLHIKFSAIDCVMINNVHMNMRFTLVTAIIIEYIWASGIHQSEWHNNKSNHILL